VDKSHKVIITSSSREAEDAVAMKSIEPADEKSYIHGFRTKVGKHISAAVIRSPNWGGERGGMQGHPPSQ